MARNHHSLKLLCWASSMAVAIAFVAPAGAQVTDNPLDQFRTGSATQESGTGQLPSPTIGGTQKQLTQEEIDQLLQGYDVNVAPSPAEKKAEMEHQLREEAFKASLNGAFPLTPDQIMEVLDRYRETREVSQERIGGVPKPSITLETISLDPGTTPATIKLSPGHVTTLNILDSTGEPWPIKDISWGGDFEVIQPQEGAHVVRISPMKAHEVGNLSIQMVDLDTPVTFSLKTQLEEVQYRFDAQLPLYGPNATPPLIEGATITTKAGREDIVRILDGNPVSGTTKLTVTGVDGRTTAYELGGNYYIRTPLSLLSPGWSSSVRSADGTAVYAINKSPVILLSDQGKMVRAMIDYE